MTRGSLGQVFRKFPHQEEKDRGVYKTLPQPAPSTNPPPYCYLQPGTSPEAAALACVKALGTETPVDALAILWELRRIAAKEASE